MRTFNARYTLRNGARGCLAVIARTSCDALLALFDTFGDQLKTCSARPVQ